MQTLTITYILSQSYDATVFYFDISFLAHVLNKWFLPNESSVSQASYRTIVLTICFQLFKKQTVFRGRVVEKKKKKKKKRKEEKKKKGEEEMHGDLPVSDTRLAFRASWKMS